MSRLVVSGLLVALAVTLLSGEDSRTLIQNRSAPRSSVYASLLAPIRPLYASWLWTRFEQAVRVGDAREVEIVLQTLLAIDRTSARSPLYLARWIAYRPGPPGELAVRRTDRQLRAMRILRAATRDFPEDPYLWVEIALLSDQVSREPEVSWQRWQQEEPLNPLASTASAWREAQARMRDKARLDPEVRDASRRSALLAADRGRFDEALKDWSEVATRLSGDPWGRIEANGWTSICQGLRDAEADACASGIRQFLEAGTKIRELSETPRHELRATLFGISLPVIDLAAATTKRGSPVLALSLIRALHNIRGLLAAPIPSAEAERGGPGSEARMLTSVLKEILLRDPGLARELPEEWKAWLR